MILCDMIRFDLNALPTLTVCPKLKSDVTESSNSARTIQCPMFANRTRQPCVGHLSLPVEDSLDDITMSDIVIIISQGLYFLSVNLV